MDEKKKPDDNDVSEPKKKESEQPPTKHEKLQEFDQPNEPFRK